MAGTARLVSLGAAGQDDGFVGGVALSLNSEPCARCVDSVLAARVDDARSVVCVCCSALLAYSRASMRTCPCCIRLERPMFRGLVASTCIIASVLLGIERGRVIIVILTLI